MASVKGNVVLNALNTITSIIFPIITFPYAARILLPEGIGTVNFLNSIVSYIVLFTSLGIPMYAVKEIAKYSDDKRNRDRITVEITILSTFLCLLGYIAVWGIAKYIPQIHSHAKLFYILSLTIIFTALGVNWFYQGIEDFKFITIRAVIIRTLAAAALFIFVRDSSDLLIYGWIIVGSTVGNNIINFFHLRKHITYFPPNIKDLKVLRHLKPALEVFIFNLITSLYIQLNSVMLGFISGDEAVGFFTAGTKISHIGLILITSLGTVLLPRCSHLIKTGDINGFNKIVNKSLDVTTWLSIPMAMGLIALSRPITILFCGEEYSEAIPVLILNTPVIILVSLTNLLGIQILYPKDKIKIVIWSVSGGALLNLIFNFFLIPQYGATGAAISTLIAEFTVLIIQLLYGKEYYPFKISKIINLKYIVGGCLMWITIYLSTYCISSLALKLIIGVFVGTVTYAGFMIISKDFLIFEFISFFKRKLRHAG